MRSLEVEDEESRDSIDGGASIVGRAPVCAVSERGDGTGTVSSAGGDLR